MHGVLLSEIKRKVPVQKLKTSKLCNKQNSNEQVTFETDSLAVGNLIFSNDKRGSSACYIS